jgi:pimeloyl-ACP methyl ester carboxylesterase
MAPLLSKRYNVLMPSIPGYGPSSPPKSGTSFTVIKAATALDAVARALGIEKYVAQGGLLQVAGEDSTHAFIGGDWGSPAFPLLFKRLS